MSASPPNGMPVIYPSLVYRDAPAAIDWLVNVFGFKPLLVVPGEDGTIAHAELLFGDTGVIMLGTARDERGAKAADGCQVVTYAPFVYVQDVDAHYQRATAAGARITHDLKDTDYGSRGYSAADLEGNVWSFGTYIPSLTPATV